MRIKKPFSKPIVLLLAVMLVWSGLPFSAFAEREIPFAGSGTTVMVCTHVHYEKCGYMEDEICNHEHDEDCGWFPNVDSVNQPVPSNPNGNNMITIPVEVETALRINVDNYYGDKPALPEADGSNSNEDVLSENENAKNKEDDPLVGFPADETRDAVELDEDLIDDFGKSTTPTDVIIIAAFEELPEETLWQGYDMGEIDSQDDLVLPQSFAATTINGESITVKVVAWESNPPFDPEVSEFYELTPIMPEDYELTEGITLPVISVFIRPEGGVQIAPTTIIGTTDAEKTANLQQQINNAPNNTPFTIVILVLLKQ